MHVPWEIPRQHTFETTSSLTMLQIVALQKKIIEILHL